MGWRCDVTIPSLYPQVAERINAALAVCRHPMAHKSGGLINDDIEGIKMSRSVVAEIVKLMGKKLLQGQNLMSVTFPVRCCQPRTILECAAYQFVFCPHYLTLAANCQDPVKRIKQADFPPPSSTQVRGCCIGKMVEQPSTHHLRFEKPPSCYPRIHHSGESCIDNNPVIHSP